MVLLLFECLNEFIVVCELEQYMYQVFKCIQVESPPMGKSLALLWLRGHRLDARNGTIRAVVRVRIITTAAAVAAAAAAAAAAGAGIIRVVVAGGLGV